MYKSAILLRYLLMMLLFLLVFTGFAEVVVASSPISCMKKKDSDEQSSGSFLFHAEESLEPRVQGLIFLLTKVIIYDNFRV